MNCVRSKLASYQLRVQKQGEIAIFIQYLSGMNFSKVTYR